MPRGLFIPSAAAALCLGSQALTPARSFAGAPAPPTLQLSSPSDLNNLMVGDTVRIDVNLGGLPATAQLELLAADVIFDESVFDTPTSVAAGEIVPNPGAFEGFADPGTATGLFEALDAGPADRIGDNGRFFSFNLTAVGAGSGLIEFDLVDALRFNPDDPLEPIEVDLQTGPGLSFTVIPEPSGLAGAALWAGLWCRAARGRRVAR